MARRRVGLTDRADVSNDQRLVALGSARLNNHIHFPLFVLPKRRSRPVSGAALLVGTFSEEALLLNHLHHLHVATAAHFYEVHTWSELTTEGHLNIGRRSWHAIDHTTSKVDDAHIGCFC